MSATAETAAPQVPAAAAAEPEKAPLVRRLWLSSVGTVKCDQHGGNALGGHIAMDRGARHHDTSLHSWDAIRYTERDLYSPGWADALACEECGARLFPNRPAA